MTSPVFDGGGPEVPELPSARARAVWRAPPTGQLCRFPGHAVASAVAALQRRAAAPASFGPERNERKVGSENGNGTRINIRSAAAWAVGRLVACCLGVTCPQEIYQKKTQLEHILLRPDSYVPPRSMLLSCMYALGTMLPPRSCLLGRCGSTTEMVLHAPRTLALFSPNLQDVRPS